MNSKFIYGIMLHSQLGNHVCDLSMHTFVRWRIGCYDCLICNCCNKPSFVRISDGRIMVDFTVSYGDVLSVAKYIEDNIQQFINYMYSVKQ